VLALFVAPLIGAVPTAATAPALIVVGSLMMTQVSEIKWSDPAIAIPAFLTLVTIPLSFSIANGLAFGFTAYAALKLVRGEFRKTHWLVWVLAALFVARFVYLGRE
jgi:AGZA family xanthine/uracil permease-like MFS transporter